MSSLHSSSECYTPACPLTTIQRTELGLIPVSPRRTHSPIDMSLSPALLEPLARLSSKRVVTYQDDNPQDDAFGTPILKIDTTGGTDAEAVSSDLRAFGPMRQQPEMDTIPLSNKYGNKDLMWDLDYSDSNSQQDALEPNLKRLPVKEKHVQNLSFNTPRIPLDIDIDVSQASNVLSDADLDRRPVMVFDSSPNSPLADAVIRIPSVLSLSRLPLLDNASSCFDTTDLSRLFHGAADNEASCPPQKLVRSAGELQ